MSWLSVLNGVECAGEEERLSGFEQNLSINSIAIPTTMECFVRSLRGNFSNDGILYKWVIFIQKVSLWLIEGRLVTS